jgi:hypothetical protein
MKEDPAVGGVQETPMGPIVLDYLVFDGWVRGQLLTEFLGRFPESGELVTFRTSDLNGDPRLRCEYVILRILERYKIAPKPLFVSPGVRGYAFFARYLVTEATGYSLAAIYAQTDTGSLIELFISILGDLETIHSLGICHGDLSEFAIKYNQDGTRMILTGFDFATFLASNKIKLYPQDYMTPFKSPHELAGNVPYKRRDDMWRWIEMIARIVEGHEYMQRMADATNGYETESLIAHKGSARMFRHSQRFAHCRKSTRNRMIRNLNAVHRLIRSLNLDDEPQYALYRELLMAILEDLFNC